MIIVILERVKPGLRGTLTRWLLEVRTGVFVGTVSSRVREYLWDSIQEKVGDGNALLIWAAKTEQGFAMRAVGENGRDIFDNEGLKMVRIRSAGGPGDMPAEND